MDSPETTEPPSRSPAVQDSPFLSFASSLSPIEPVKIMHVAQAFGDHNLPPPPPVFTTPRVNPPRKVTLLKRSQNPSLPDAESSSPRFADSTTSLPENLDVSQQSVSQSMVQLAPCTQKEYNFNISSPQGQHCSSPSCTDEFLADPVEDCENLSGSSDLCSKQAAEMPQDLQDGYFSTKGTQKKCGKQNPGQAQARTPPVSVNEFMAHPLECSTATDLPNLISKQDVSNTTKEKLAKLHVSKGCVEKGTRTRAALSSTSSYHVEEDSVGEEPLVLENLVQINGNLKLADEDMESNERSLKEQVGSVFENVNDYINLESAIGPSFVTRHDQNSMDHIATDHSSFVSKDTVCDTVSQGRVRPTDSLGFCCHGTQDVELHIVEIGQRGKWDCTPQLRQGSLQNSQVDNNCHDRSGAMSNIPAANEIPYDCEEGSQHQRGMRKRLQFEAVEDCGTSVGCYDSSWNLKDIASNTVLPANSLDLETVNVSHPESIANSSNKQLPQSENVSGNASSTLSLYSYRTPETHIEKVDRFPRKSGRSPVTAPRPSGIGLHLNSIGSGAPVNSNVITQLPGTDSGVYGERSLSGNDDHVPQDSNTCVASTSLMRHYSVKSTVSSDTSLPCSALENSEEKMQQNRTTKLPSSSVSYQSPLEVKPLNSSPQLKFIDSHTIPCDLKRSPSEDVGRSEESNRTSPRKKRKKTPENEGCKRCNCKRSKCLKLYCDCFAAGVYCAEPCACQECFNRPEYEESVLATRQQIESRNPLAFAPKVVLRVTNPPENHREESKHITPASARHKRGCNCKRSMCLKKYCECYQAGVGCSFGCRCEGCKNTFGRKDGCGQITEMEHKKSKEDGLETDQTGGKLEVVGVRTEILKPEQCHSRLSPLTPLFPCSNSGNDVPKSQPPARYYPSPESGESVLPSYVKSPSSPRDSISSNRFAKEREGALPLVPYIEELECHNAVKVDPFSPKWDVFPEICNLSPLPNPSPSTSSTSTASEIRERKILRPKLFHGSGRLSVGSLRWRCSPITPIPQFGERKLVLEPDSDSGLQNNLEDDTPEILKDTDSPVKSVKVSSPNQKRVSPPHKCLQETRSTSSPGLRSGRKFILQSVPSFPPLTPYRNNNRGHGT